MASLHKQTNTREAAVTDIAIAQVRHAVQELRKIHHHLRHEHTDKCAECVNLAWLETQGF